MSGGADAADADELELKVDRRHELRHDPDLSSSSMASADHSGTPPFRYKGEGRENVKPTRCAKNIKSPVTEPSNGAASHSFVCKRSMTQKLLGVSRRDAKFHALMANDGRRSSCNLIRGDLEVVVSSYELRAAGYRICSNVRPDGFCS